jgi:hypothetical protein
MGEIEDNAWSAGFNGTYLNTSSPSTSEVSSYNHGKMVREQWGLDKPLFENNAETANQPTYTGGSSGGDVIGGLVAIALVAGGGVWLMNESEKAHTPPTPLVIPANATKAEIIVESSTLTTHPYNAQEPYIRLKRNDKVNITTSHIFDRLQSTFLDEVIATRKDGQLVKGFIYESELREIKPRQDIPALDFSHFTPIPFTHIKFEVPRFLVNIYDSAVVTVSVLDVVTCKGTPITYMHLHQGDTVTNYGEVFESLHDWETPRNLYNLYKIEFVSHGRQATSGRPFEGCANKSGLETISRQTDPNKQDTSSYFWSDLKEFGVSFLESLMPGSSPFSRQGPRTAYVTASSTTLWKCSGMHDWSPDEIYDLRKLYKGTAMTILNDHMDGNRAQVLLADGTERQGCIDIDDLVQFAEPLSKDTAITPPNRPLAAAAATGTVGTPASQSKAALTP